MTYYASLFSSSVDYLGGGGGGWLHVSLSYHVKCFIFGYQTIYKLVDVYGYSIINCPQHLCIRVVLCILCT